MTTDLCHSLLFQNKALLLRVESHSLPVGIKVSIYNMVGSYIGLGKWQRSFLSGLCDLFRHGQLAKFTVP